MSPILSRQSNLLGFAICCAAVLSFYWLAIRPVAGEFQFNSGELQLATRFAACAYRGMSAGQILLTFANDCDVALQPIFLYYTMAPHELTAIFQLLGMGPYHAVLLVVVMAAAGGIFGLYATARALGGDPIL